MAGLRLELPTIQNWSCHNCGGCCRQHAIEVTDEERRRILGQHWTEADGVASERPLFVRFAGLPWKKRYRLAHQSDGACIFLDEKGLCRIHSKFGEAAKPLPCRIYPYAFHPAGKKVTVSLRFSCPSVVANRGGPVSKQSSELKRIARWIVPEGFEDGPPPAISSSEQVDWPDFLRFVDALDQTLSDSEVAITTKLRRALFWVHLVEQAKFEQVRGERLGEFLQLIVQTAREEIPEGPADLQEPSRVGRLQFRMLVAHYARRDTFADVDQGWRGRWDLFRAAMRFARGQGNVPLLQDVFQEVPFSAMEKPFGDLPDGAEELFTRYFRVKIQGIHFCGPAYYGVPLSEGFHSLLLMFPSTLWLARWLAVGEGRGKLVFEDITRAIAIADHHHGYSPAFRIRNLRRRVRMLAQVGDLPRLCLWYSR